MTEVKNLPKVILQKSILFQGDCIEVMQNLIKQGVKVDAIITDPPYGTTACKWDSAIPFEPMWDCLHKLIKDKGATILFGSEPFSSALRMSNIKEYKYDWVWVKPNSTGFVNANARPLKKHELISVYSYGSATSTSCTMTYNPQGLIPYNKLTKYGSRGGYLGTRESQKNVHIQKYSNYPTSILEFGLDKEKLHPTQKPVALIEYLIKTYTNEGETVLDFTMGSGSTGVACQNTNRKFIGIEKDEKYFNIAVERLQKNLIDMNKVTT